MRSFVDCLYIFCLIALSSQICSSSNEGGTIHHNNSHKKHYKSWGYRDEDKNILPKNWYEKHAKCYGQNQSPIDIHLYATEYDRFLENIAIKKSNKFENNLMNNEIWNMTNNGHSVLLTPINTDFNFVMKPERDIYELQQMHFHWRGSEHHINGVKFAGELHLVHRNRNNKNKFSVIAFLIKISNEDNPFAMPIIKKLRNIRLYGSFLSIDDLDLNKLLRVFEISNYFRYSGSLTTPECDEVVEWVVVDSPVLTLSEDQLLEFQEIQDHHGHNLLSNNRPVQMENERTVRRSFLNIQLKNKKGNFNSASLYNSAGNAYKFKLMNQTILLILLMMKLIFQS